MSKVIGATIAALVLVVAMVAPTLAHTATVTCEHITLGNVPVGVSASLTPGPITITPPNPTTSISGTYEVPPATYLITFCLLYTSPSPRDGLLSRMPSSA